MAKMGTFEYAPRTGYFEGSEELHQLLGAPNGSMTSLTDLLTRWRALGEAAAEVNRLVQQVAATSQKAGAEKQLGAAAFRDIDDRLGRLAQDSEELAQAAQADAFVELGRQAESLRQQLLSARNKFRLLERRRGSAGEP